MARRLSVTASYVARAQSVRSSEFYYELPASRIAVRPVSERSSSKLLVAPGWKTRPSRAPLHCRFDELPDFLPRGARMVVNTSRVIPARLIGRKSSGGRAELLLLSPEDGGDPGRALGEKVGEGIGWKCFIGGRRIRSGDVLDIANGPLKAKVLRKDGATGVVAFEGVDLSLAEAIDEVGKTPLPPYISRDADEKDSEEYQTVYAEEAGSVAAPTAGLHLTDEVLSALARRGVSRSNVILHVGAGTFAQMGGETAGQHSMHEERFEVSVETLNNIARDAQEGEMIVAVGTTSVRTLESVYWFGASLLGFKPRGCHGVQNSRAGALLGKAGCRIGQWDPYEALDACGSSSMPTSSEALSAVADALEQEGVESIAGATRMLIVPGYPFKVVDALVTNFHQPSSTLLMLVAAFCGGNDALLRIYNEALSHDYRFLSYGDSSLFYRAS